MTVVKLSGFSEILFDVSNQVVQIIGNFKVAQKGLIWRANKAESYCNSLVKD